jgi:site-specific DNA recombinase
VSGGNLAPLRAVIYTRVSSDRDGQGRFVSEQEASCRQDCERNGWTVAEVLTDNDRGASRWSRKDRPAYRELAAVLATGRIHVLVTWEASRAQRDLAAYVGLRDLCVEHAVRWSYNGRLYDLTDDDDRFSTGIDALMSEREAGLTRKRVLRSVEARATTGKPHGRLLDGYMIKYDPATGKPLRRVLDPERAPIIKTIAERLLAGDPAYTIAADLNRDGITTRSGKPWTGANVVKRVMSPTLAGLRVHRGEVIEGLEADWEPILTLDEYHRLVALLSDPKRRLNKEGNHVRHLGTGIYLCGVCEAPVRMISGYRPDRTRRVRYSCSKNHCVMRAAEPTDAKVERTLITYLSRPDILADLNATAHDADTQAAAADVARLRAQLIDARQKVDEGKLTLDDFVYFRQRWEPQLADAEQRARPKWIPNAVYDVAGPDAEERWKALPISARRAIVKALVTVKIHPTARGNQHRPFDADAIEVTPKESG